MNEVKRWLDDSPPEAVLTLLRSGRTERAPRRVLQRTLLALGTASTTTAVAAGSAGLGTAAKLGPGMLGIIVKWGGAGLLGGTVLAGAVAGVSRISATHGRSEPPPSFAPAPPAAPEANPAPELPRGGATPAPSAETIETVTAPPVAKPSVSPSSHLEAPPTAQEIGLVDQARSRLRAGDGEAVLHLLIGYEEAFRPAHFEPEVLYLRMRSAVLRGDTVEAVRTARLIVTRYPQSPVVGQAERLLRATEPAKSE